MNTFNFEASAAGEFVQSILAARNQIGAMNRPIYYCPLKSRLVNPDNPLYTETTNFGAGGFNYRRRTIPDAAKIGVGNWNVFPGSNGLLVARVPTGAGWYRGYFRFRAVCEAVPSDDWTLNEDAPFETLFGSGLGIGTIGAGNSLADPSGFVQTYDPTMSIVRIGNVGTFPFKGSSKGLILNRIPGAPTGGAFYFDRMVLASFPGNNASLFAGLNRFNWSGPIGGGSTFEGGSADGDYIGNETGFAHGQSWSQSAASLFPAQFHNDHGHAKSLFDPSQNIISDSFLGSTGGTSIDLYQFGEVQHMAWLPAQSWEAEQIIDLASPLAATNL